MRRPFRESWQRPALTMVCCASNTRQLPEWICPTAFAKRRGRERFGGACFFLVGPCPEGSPLRLFAVTPMNRTHSIQPLYPLCDSRRRVRPCLRAADSVPRRATNQRRHLSRPVVLYARAFRWPSLAQKHFTFGQETNAQGQAFASMVPSQVGKPSRCRDAEHAVWSRRSTG